MPNALIGYSGFVGSTLRRQTSFDAQYHSSNISEITGRKFDLVVCAAAPARKWVANREPEADRRQIDSLIARIDGLCCEAFVLISTVDVFSAPTGVDESSMVDESALHAYGLHRRLLERFVESHFRRHLIVRLPGLVGPGLRKNVVFDFLNDHNLHAIDSRSVFQFYPMVNLWFDIKTALDADLRLVHLTAAPISVTDIAQAGFGRTFAQSLHHQPAAYDVRTLHAGVFGGAGNYQYTTRETLLAVRAYAQSEPRAMPSAEAAQQ